MNPNLTRVRAGVRAVLALGVAASVLANVLHAQPTLVGRAIAAWSPLALLLTVELISRVPVHRPALSGLRMAATASIAGIAAWVSYWHMAEVASRNGESVTSAHLLPLSVDGLVVVASISLVEIAARLRATLAATADDVVDPVPGIAEDAVPANPEPEPEPAGEPAAPVPAPGKPVKKAAPVSTAVKVGRLRDRHPEWTVPQIAERAGVSDRTARRHLNQRTTQPSTEPAEAAPPDMARPVSADLAA